MTYKTYRTYLNFHTLFLLYLLMWLECPIASAALEKSSKRECAMCHVMWLDVFRSEKETLIEWQPGNVLMKDTQGIVSSEEICYSCHDGYVADSRYVVWKDKNHTTFKKPSGNIRIPEKLTLSNKDEIYCGTCHSPHSGREAVPGASSEETIPGPMSFLRLPNIDSGLCEACHVNEADYKRTNSHPVHTDKLKIPEELFESGSVRGEKKDTAICQTCHKVHGAKGENLTVVENSQSALCMDCHKERTIAGTQHDLRVTMPAETNMNGQLVSESGPCGACHVPHKSAGFKLWARKMVPGEPVSQVCLSCHSGKSDSKRKGIGPYSHPNNVKAISKEDSKFSRSRSADQLPLFYEGEKQKLAGSIQCFTCHNAHQWDPDSQADRGGKGIRGDASNSFLRISNSQSSALCVACHQDKWQLLSFDHNLVRTAPEAKNIQGFTAEISGPCGACHMPHNGLDKNLWSRDISTDKGSELQYCTGCHLENGVAKAKVVGRNDHPINVVLRGDHIPPADHAIAMLPLYNEQGGRENGDRIMCRSCHDPHIWSVVDERTGPSVVAADTTAGTAETMEGDARNSFLRKVASPTPDLCVVCHEDTALLIGTDHDLSVTAPSAKNQLGQTVKASGPCGVCHAIHNSPGNRLIWVHAYGPVGENQHPMNGVCTCCHSKGGIAENKLPRVETHPAGQLITNIMTHDNQSMDHIRIFDDNWKEVTVGDLSCSSCHSFYKWDHRVKKQGPGSNIEGNANTSFLRVPSDRAVCIDCHGETALWRYAYFHSLKKREMLKNVHP